ncbi:MAG TPA: hypothetical protein VGV06_11705 [Methylomirabilota bacterium]|nr:hypothetical protein [Methylomirabilota bacterium]
MAEPPGAEPAGYRIFRSLARFLAGLFYRRAEVAGLERVPLSGPRVVAASHHQGLMDEILMALLPTGFFALSWTERLHRVRREARGLLTVLVDRDLRAHLVARRRAIMTEFQDLLRLVPEPVLEKTAR